jgi:hypothetical protein
MTVIADGEVIKKANVNSEDDWTTLEIVGTGKKADYKFSVTGQIKGTSGPEADTGGSSDEGADLEPNDEITERTMENQDGLLSDVGGQTVRGQIINAKDTYKYSGALIDFTARGDGVEDMVVLKDGQPIHNDMDLGEDYENPYGDIEDVYEDKMDQMKNLDGAEDGSEVNDYDEDLMKDKIDSLSEDQSSDDSSPYERKEEQLKDLEQ